MNDKSQNINRQLIEAVNAVQELVDQAIEAAGDDPATDSPLSQLGLRNGREIVMEYISFGEAGAAFEHILYMIEETGVVCSERTKGLLFDLSDALGTADIEDRINSSKTI